MIRKHESCAHKTFMEPSAVFAVIVYQEYNVYIKAPTFRVQNIEIVHY